MSRLIDADALIEAYDRTHEGEPGKARQLILDAPTIEERKTGRWIFKEDFRIVDGYDWKCDQCGSWQRYTSNFCPSCGCKMEG